MELTVIGTGSKGNGYVLQNDKEALILECGMPLQAYLPALGFKLSKVSGAFVTHSHGDHAGHVREFADRYIPVWMTAGELGVILNKLGAIPPCDMPKMRRFPAGSFSVVAFPTVHDTPDPVGFLVSHEEIGTLLFLTDTSTLNVKLPNNITHVLIEINHDAETLWDNVQSGRVNYYHAERVSESHLSLEEALSVLRRIKNPSLRSVTIIHQSAENSNTERYEEEIKKLLGDPSVAVRTACKGMRFEINKMPF